jgi:hypothetical protein
MGRASRRKRERREAEKRWGTRVERTADGRRRIHFEPGTTAAEETFGMLAEQEQRFREKFGRDPGPDDPIFFDPDPDPDPDADEPRPFPVERLEAETVKVMQQVGLAPAYIYAYQQTGLMLTEQNLHLLSDDDVEEFYDAMDRYDALHRP